MPYYSIDRHGDNVVYIRFTICLNVSISLGMRNRKWVMANMYT